MDKNAFTRSDEDVRLYTGSVVDCVLCIMCFCVPVLHALVHAAVLDTLFLHVGAASSQTLHCLL